ncbi:hypothetical protein BHE74_00007384 [Ensete ventricosum]|nr:hypothetical protein BHE74_00007384 [Ensete ventricosum]RZR79572.1 hypothetical protein BHM03_00005293 [Ensete ventricosum]
MSSSSVQHLFSSLDQQKEAETHLPELGARDGISIPMEDIGTSQVWNMRYRWMIRGVKVRQPAVAGEPSGRTAEKKAHRRRNGLEKTGGADKMRGNSIIHGDASPSVHG